jgi:phosphatidylinositol phospholipase C, delta
MVVQAKNLYVSEKEGMQEKEVSVDAESSSTETSASDSDLREEIKHEWRKARENEVEMIKGVYSRGKQSAYTDPILNIGLKSELTKAKKVLDRVNPRRGSNSTSSRPVISSNVPTTRPVEKPKVKMSLDLVALLVYTVGVKCRGLNKKEVYAPEHVFSLSENTANKILKQSMADLIKHNRTHVVRIYPKGIRIGSTNYEPHRYWSAGAQLVAINWQTFGGPLLFYKEAYTYLL